MIARTVRDISSSMSDYDNGDLFRRIALAASLGDDQITIHYNHKTYNQLYMTLTEIGYTVNLNHPLKPTKVTIGWL
jgi:hypothetical protein